MTTFRAIMFCVVGSTLALLSSAASPYLWEVSGSPPLLVNGNAATPGTRAPTMANGSFIYATGHHHIEVFRADPTLAPAPAASWLWSVAADSQVLSLQHVPSAGSGSGSLLVATATSVSLRDMATGNVAWMAPMAVVPSTGDSPAIAVFPADAPTAVYVLVSPPTSFELNLVAIEIATGVTRFTVQNANWLPTAFNASMGVLVTPGLNSLTFAPQVMGINATTGATIWTVATQLYVTADASVAVAWKPQEFIDVNSTLLFIDACTGTVIASASYALQRDQFEYSGALMTLPGGKRGLVLANGHELAGLAVADGSVVWSKMLPPAEAGSCGIVGSALVPESNSIVIHGCAINLTTVNQNTFGTSPVTVFAADTGAVRWATNITFDVSAGANPRRFTLLQGGVIFATQRTGFVMLSTAADATKFVTVSSLETPIATSLVGFLRAGSEAICGVTNSGNFVAFDSP